MSAHTIDIVSYSTLYCIVQAETIRQQEDYGDKLEQQTRRYEDRITELHSVIAELKKKLDQRKFNIIKYVLSIQVSKCISYR